MKKLLVLLVSLLLLSCTNDDNLSKLNPTPIGQTVRLHIPAWFKGNYYAMTDREYVIFKDKLYVTDSTITRIQEIVRVTPFGGSTSTFIEAFNMDTFKNMVSVREEEGVLDGLKFYKVWDVDEANSQYILKFWVTQQVVNPAHKITWRVPEYCLFRNVW